VRKKNREFVAIKNMLIFLVGLLTFFVIGYAFAFGDSSVGIIGAQSDYVGVYQANGLYHEREFPWYFATSLIVSLLVTGSMSERAKLEPLVGFILVLHTILYPVILSWAWNL
jgi:Amt family ammonium transporter